MHFYSNITNGFLLFSAILRLANAASAPNLDEGGDDASSEALSFDEIARRYTRRTAHGVHLPIVRHETSSKLLRRGQSASIGLGNYVDIAYSVLVTVGGVATPLIIDTGSSDLWLMSDACTFGCSARRGQVTLYPQATLNASGLDAELYYGDSSTGTSAFGVIGHDTVSLAGITLPDQYFAAVNRTNVSIVDTGNTGIFGLGFPTNSVVWSELFVLELESGSNSDSQRRNLEEVKRREEDETRQTLQDVKYGNRLFPHLNLYSRFPSLSNILSPVPKSSLQRRQVSRVMSSLLKSFDTLGSFMTRLIVSSEIESPLLTITLQRNTIDVGGNIGLLSIGELPPDVSSDNITWAPVRTYSRQQGGLPAPPDSPTEEYAIAWEIPVDDVYLNGERLPRSTLTPSTISLSALVDTGNSLIRGPQDVVQEIYTRIAGRRARTRLEGVFPCNQPHTLAFSIGGKLFPVDPRDFAAQVYVDNVSVCASTVVATDTPGPTGYQFSWSLGAPFLKSVVSSYYFGNLTYPSQDPPRIGFLSTVPADADDQLRAAVANADKLDDNFPALSIVAPSGLPVTEATVRPSSIPEAGSGSISKPLLPLAAIVLTATSLWYLLDYV